MDLTSAAGSLFAAIGLSGAAGLNAWIPLFAAGLLERVGAIGLAAPYDHLGSNLVLVVTGVCLLVDLVGDKIPGVDHVLHVAGTAIHPIAGALVFAGQAGVGTDVPSVVSLLLGACVAGGLHGVRASARPVVTGATLGIGNPFVSAGEDVASVTLTALAFLVPLLAALLVLALAVLTVRVLRRRGRRTA